MTNSRKAERRVDFVALLSKPFELLSAHSVPESFQMFWARRHAGRVHFCALHSAFMISITWHRADRDDDAFISGSRPLNPGLGLGALVKDSISAAM